MSYDNPSDYSWHLIEEECIRSFIALKNAALIEQVIDLTSVWLQQYERKTIHRLTRLFSKLQDVSFTFDANFISS